MTDSLAKIKNRQRKPSGKSLILWIKDFLYLFLNLCERNIPIGINKSEGSMIGHLPQTIKFIYKCTQ